MCRELWGRLFSTRAKSVSVPAESLCRRYRNNSKMFRRSALNSWHNSECSRDIPWIPNRNSEFSGDLPWIYNVIWIFRRSSLKSWLSSQRSGHISWTPDIFLNVQEIYLEFLRRFVEKTSQLKVGDPLDETVFMGAVNR